MKKISIVFALVPGICFFVSAQPMQDMTPNSIALDYSGLWRGENITKKAVGAHESVHQIRLHYAPLPYGTITAGLGMSSYSVNPVEQTQFKGRWGFTPSLGVTFVSPYLAEKLLRIVVGGSFYYLNSRSADRTYAYAGAFVDPRAGVVFSIGEYADLEIGGRGLFIFGSMQKESEAGLNFSNTETARGYFSFTMHTPSEGAYCTIDFHASPKISMNWAHGPVESAIGLTLGCVLRTDWKRGKSDEPKEPDFPGFEEIRKKEKEMKKEIE